MLRFRLSRRLVERTADGCCRDRKRRSGVGRTGDGGRRLLVLEVPSPAAMVVGGVIWMPEMLPHRVYRRPQVTAECADLEVLRQRLQRTDWYTLGWVAECRFVTAETVAILQFRSEWGVRLAQASLHRLERVGCIVSSVFSRVGRTGPVGGGASPRCWHLTALGRSAVAAWLDVTEEQVVYTGSEAVMNPTAVLHRLALSELRAVWLHYLAQVGGQVTRWTTEAQLAKRLVADAICSFRLGGFERAYCTEIDRNTESAPRFASKIQQYQEALKSRAWESYSDMQPLVLTIVAVPGEDGQRRVKQLKVAVDQVTDKRFVLFVAVDQLYRVSSRTHGRFPGLDTHWADPVCLVSRLPETERRPVISGREGPDGG